jgi:hypothetical protein
MIIVEDQEVSMINVRVMALASLGFVVGCQPLLAQTPFQYREYVLASSVASVVKISGARESETKTTHERPARLQELEWRAPYVRSGAQMADPVHDVLFSFYDDQLYQVFVTYDRDRMEGLTKDDLIASISTTYGVPLLRNLRTPHSTLAADVHAATTILAQWEDAASMLTLTQETTYSPQFQLVLVSKALNPRARAAIKEAVRLDAQEAPQRELDQRNKAGADALIEGEKARVLNKPAFRP